MFRMQRNQLKEKIINKKSAHPSNINVPFMWSGTKQRDVGKTEILGLFTLTIRDGLMESKSDVLLKSNPPTYLLKWP